MSPIQRRDWNVVRSEFEGDEEAGVKAGALAAISDAEFLESLIHAKAALDRFGGQVTLAALREKRDAYGNEVEHDEVGTHATLGYVFRYEAHSDLAKGPKEVDAKRDDAPAPLPIEISGVNGDAVGAEQEAT